MAERFQGARLHRGESAVAADAVRKRKTVYCNRVDPAQYPMAAEYRALAIMAAPLVVSHEVIGAAAFLHDADPDFFNDDLAAKATILAGQLGSVLEASRLTLASREEHRRAEILAEVAQALHAVPDAAAVVEAVADRLRVLLRTRLVCILLRETSGFGLRAVSAESPQLAASVRARHDRKGLYFAADLANRAVSAGEPISVAIEPSTHSLGDLIPAGVLIAAPFRTSRTQGAVLVYPRQGGPFTSDEKALVAALAGFGAVAIANAELYGTARAQAHELHQLLEILSELASVRDLDQFLQRFSIRAADFLGFARAFIGLLEEDDAFHVRWGADNGKSVLVDLRFPEGVASRALLDREVFSTDDAAKVPGANLQVIAQFQVRQLLAVPLLGTEGQVLGMFGVLNHLDEDNISKEDIRRAKLLAAQVAVVLQATRNLDLSERHRSRSEALMGLALELNSFIRLPEFASAFVRRASQLIGAHGAALCLRQDSGLELVLMEPQPERNQSAASLAAALQAIVEKYPDTVVCLTANEIFGPDLASTLNWVDCTLVRLVGGAGELIGALCLANRGTPLSQADRQFLQAIAGHASVGLENARLFARLDRANRHWMEIFDAISDFIVVHDESLTVLRVNRSLAEFIGLKPQELVGLNMSALLAVSGEVPLHGCPFCRTLGESGEYVHPVLERSYLVSTSPVHGPNAEGMQTIHVLKDVTDRREAERRYRELFDNIQEGLFFSTEDGRFIEVNDALVRMLRFDSREELLQANISNDLFYTDEQREYFAATLRRNGGLRNHEETLKRKDGSAVYVLINALAVLDAHGRVTQYRGLMLDISGLKSYQVELQRERDFSGKILDNTQNLIAVADTAGLITYVNRRWYDLGYEQTQVIGRRLEELVALPRRQKLNEAFSSTLAGSQVDNLELLMLRADGRTGQFAVNISPMRDEAGNVISVVLVMADITDAASLHAKLLHAEKLAAVGQLVSGVAHEVNNPLTAILGFADLLMENPELPDTARKDLRVILQEAQRTKQIVQNLLSFARQMPPQQRPVQLNAILRRTVQLRAYDFHSRGVEVIEQLDEQLPAVIGDAQQLQQVFLNILNNAYDAVHETGRPARIEIMTARRGDMVEACFRDNGHGISHPDHIFDPFFTTKEVGKGTGLGLSICYGIVREHSGEIVCHNNTDGPGATFVVRLPVASESFAVAALNGVVEG
jgi:two-component system NtrC family sensor kinase